MAAHDRGYKLLFSHPRLVADLLRGFVPGLDEADPSRLERVPAQQVANGLAERSGDLAWRLRGSGPGAGDLVVLLEFQSTVDRFMALRIHTYVGLLAQGLQREGKLTAAGALPQVVPVVVYNGLPPWGAPAEVGELFARAPAALGMSPPMLSYLLIDVRRLPQAAVEQPGNLAAALFRLERCRSGDEAGSALAALARELKAAGSPELSRAFATFVRQVWRKAPEFADFAEDEVMLENAEPTLEDALDEWAEQMLAQGRDEGRDEGRAEGERLGEAQLLLRQLAFKFGPLDEATRARVAAARPEELFAWGERLLGASRLTDVFAG